MRLDTINDQIRLTSEAALTIGAFFYILAALREARFLGGHMFVENLVRSNKKSSI